MEASSTMMIIHSKEQRISSESSLEARIHLEGLMTMMTTSWETFLIKGKDQSQSKTSNKMIGLEVWGLVDSAEWEDLGGWEDLGDLEICKWGLMMMMDLEVVDFNNSLQVLSQQEDQDHNLLRLKHLLRMERK
jgi:hypothetical protein